MNTNNTDNADKSGDFKSDVKHGLGKSLGFILGLIGAFIIGVVVMAVLGNIFTAQSQKADLNSTPTHTTEVSLEINGEDELIAPDESREIVGKLRNGSKTDSCYVFIEVEYNPDAWRIQEPDGWVEVEDGIYAYGDQIMTPLESEQELQFQFTATVIAKGAVYQGLSKEDFKISLRGMAINSSVSRERVEESYEDYENGGNSQMIADIERS